ncbi:hypothetical protein EAF00_011059 [Botryotinia globosa]|nr:hypothetical protein EAF00_011059 [Botryotinia globosa]
MQQTFKSLHQKELRVNIQYFRHATNIQRTRKSPPERPASQHMKFQICNETKVPSGGANTKRPEGDYTHNEKVRLVRVNVQKSEMSVMFPQFRERTRGKMARVQVSTDVHKAQRGVQPHHDSDSVIRRATK